MGAPRPTITADIEFFPADRGGRRQPVDPLAGTYMPHVVVQGENYLGVRFVAGPADRRGRYTLELMYYGDVDYSPLREGARFTIREGPNVVGEGVVVRPAGDVAGDGR